MQSELPLVSVVIPTYNYGRYVGEAVDSALAQTYPSVEVIVIDDGSTDDTRDRLVRYGDRIRYVYQVNAGLSAARNTGIREAMGRYIAFLDSDDQFHPRRIELQIPVAESDSQIGIVTSQCTSGVEVHWDELPSPPIPSCEITLDDLVVRSRFGPGGVLARRECFDVVGFFDETLRSVEDRDMWIRIASRFKVVRLDASLWWYRTTPGSMSRNPERMEHFERVVLERAFRMPELAGRWALRRKSLGLAASSSCFMFNETGRPSAALKRIVQSFYWWPVPFRNTDVRSKLVRPRLLMRTLTRSILGVE